MIAKICTAIAEQEGMEQFFLFTGREAFQNHYTTSLNGNTDGSKPESGCLGEWRTGKLSPLQ